MSIHRSYYSKSNTLISNSYTNTARNPIVELFFGKVENIQLPTGFTRYIFDLDLSLLQEKVNTGVISDDCGVSLTHTLRMKNTSAFDQELINDTTSSGRRRATSFDLILFRIPKTSGATGSAQTWDSGVGYDYYDYNVKIESDKSFSDRPSNWYQRNTLKEWSTDGIYDNQNSLILTGAGVNYTGLTILDTQHFEFGDEDIEFDMTTEINNILNNNLSNLTGWGIAYVPDLENISGMSENYSVGFFSPHTQTFYEPFLETVYSDLVNDSRNAFYCETSNYLYLYVYKDGVPINFDANPVVDIIDLQGTVVHSNLPTCLVTIGIYRVTVPSISCANAPCLYIDLWKNLSINGESLSNQENEFALLTKKGKYKIGTTTEEPKIYGFDFSGIKQNEKVLNTDVRKVSVTIKQAYSSKTVLNNVKSYYRIYVRESAKTEVQVQDWTEISKSTDGHFFVFDTRDKIPNEYFVDIKVITDRNTDTYKRELQFLIVSKK
jgi:hypothetical protein